MRRRRGQGRWVAWAVVVIAVGVLSAAALARKGDKNATGRITEVKDMFMGITVIGETEDGYLWLGCTLWPDEIKERDFPVRKVSGRFEESFGVPEINADYVVALWRWKVDKDECHNGEGGKACKYCVRNGYHMEDRIARESGTWTPN